MQQIWRVITVLVLCGGVLGSSAGGAGLVSAQEQPLSIIFMHHSTGLGLITQGGVREAFTALGYAFWDHGYNDEGLVDLAGDYLGVNWDVPGDNTDPDGWYAIFAQPVTDPPTNTFSYMLQHDVIIFKSCFPNSHITDEEMLAQYQRYFLAIRDVIDQHPDKLFIAFTTPPLVPNETDAEAAARARQWAAYLTSDEYLVGHPNLAVFDFFTLLADENGYLRAEYRGDEWDSHPNELANRTVGPLLVAFVDQAVRGFMPEQAPPSVDLSLAGSEPESQESAPLEGDAEPVSALEAEALADVLQLDTDVWGQWEYTGDLVSAFACGAGVDGYDDDSALVLVLDIQPEITAGCGFDLAPQPGWTAAQGVSFYARTDAPELVVRVAFGVRDPAQTESEATPFDVELRLSNPEWELVRVRWDDITKAEWYGDIGVAAFDPAQVVWFAFDVGTWDSAQTGTLWVDDITLLYE